jgi:hypothetical protein
VGKIRQIAIIFFTAGAFLVCTGQSAPGQIFNPYQHDYQGWDGNNIKRSPFRAILNKFSLSISTGYGRTFYSHQLDGDLYETDRRSVLLGDYSLPQDSINYTGVINWFNAPELVSGKARLTDDSRVVSSDTTDIVYKGGGNSYPLAVSLTFDINRFRIGGGFNYELHSVREMTPKSGAMYSYKPDFKSTSLMRYYFTMAIAAYEYRGWAYHADFQIGKVIYGKAFDKNTTQSGLYFNLGIPVEWQFSEYFWFFARPSVDIKNFTQNLPYNEGGNQMPRSVQHNQPAVYLNLGIRIKYPEVPRCPIKSCETQLKHVHFSKEFRGQAVHKEQNPKIGEIHPRTPLIRLRNRRHTEGAR